MPSRRPLDSQSSESDQDKLAAKLQVIGRRGVGRSEFVFLPTPRVTGHGSLDAALKELVRLRANQLEADAVGQRVANEGGEQFESNIGWRTSFTIAYDPTAIVPSHRYAVRVVLMKDTRLLFTTDQIYPALTGGSPASVQVLLKRVGGGQ